MMIMPQKVSEASGPNEAMVLVVAHCILNRSTRWWQKGQPIERNKGPVDKVLQFLTENKIGVIQLPCPEFAFLGNPRSPATKDDYESLPGFKEHCKRLAVDSAKQLQALVEMGRNPRVTVLAIVGLERSPSCGIESSPRKVRGTVVYVKEKGLFFDALEKEIENLGLEVQMLGLDRHQPDELCRKLTELLKSNVL